MGGHQPSLDSHRAMDLAGDEVVVMSREEVV
jgi:hypothetical protein